MRDPYLLQRKKKDHLFLCTTNMAQALLGCSEMRWLFTLLSCLLRTTNQKGIWVGRDTRKMQYNESVSPPKEHGIGNPTLLTPENQAFSWRLVA